MHESNLYFYLPWQRRELTFSSLYIDLLYLNKYDNDRTNIKRLSLNHNAKPLSKKEKQILTTSDIDFYSLLLLALLT